jgi:hypothetical protein
MSAMMRKFIPMQNAGNFFSIADQEAAAMKLLLFFLGIILLLCLPAVAQAADITVSFTPDTDCSDNVCDFQSALDYAESNGESDTISLPSTVLQADRVLKTVIPRIIAVCSLSKRG